MKAITVGDDAAHSLRWEEVPDPVPGASELLLEVHATAVNRADLLQRRGLYPPPPGAPPWLGLEAAGVVIEVGQPETSGIGSNWRPGARVCALLSGGGYAEKVVVSREHVLPCPLGLSFEEAASLPEAFTTAWLNLSIEAGLQSGETVLIHAGASGVGLAAIQIARERRARVIATVGSEAKANACRAHGADHVLIHTRDDVTAGLTQLAAESPTGGIDIVLDCLGGADLAAHLPLLSIGGRWILIGLMRGGSATIDLRSLLSKRIRLIGSTLRSRPPSEKSEAIQELRDLVWPAFERGRLKPTIHRILPITEAELAQEILQRNENIGKVVLTVSR